MADLAADPTPAPAASPAPSRWRSADETATSPRSLSLDPTAGARPCEASPQDGDTQETGSTAHGAGAPLAAPSALRWSSSTSSLRRSSSTQDMLSSGAHPFALTASEARLFKMSMWDVGSAINIAGENDAATADGEAAVRPTVQFAVPVPPAPDLTQGGLQETERSIVSELSESANRRPGLTRQKTLMRHRLVVHERIHEEEAKVQRRPHLPEFWWTAVPILFSVWYSCAALFPLEARARAPWLLWSDGALVRVDGVPEICPRESICSQGVFQIVLISLARLSAFASYPIMMMTFMSKMHSTIHFLSDTYLGNFIPFAALHGVHRSMGLAYFLLAWLHTITHVIRYSVRLQVAEQLGSTVGVSGIFAIFAMTLVVWGMTLAKRGHWYSNSGSTSTGCSCFSLGRCSSIPLAR